MEYDREIASIIQESTMSKEDMLFCINSVIHTREKMADVKKNGIIIPSFNLKTLLESNDSESTSMRVFDDNDKEL